MLGGKSARIGASARVKPGGSARLGDSERLAVDPSQIRGESARMSPGDSARMPEDVVGSGSAADEPIVIADSAEGKVFRDGEVVPILDPGSSDETMRDTAPSFAVDDRAMIERPSRERAAPRTKSACPPKPL